MPDRVTSASATRTLAIVVLACLALAASGAVAHATPLGLVWATPETTSDDGPALPAFAARLTFSPDGDGRNDVVDLRACAPARKGVALQVYSWQRPWGWLRVVNAPGVRVAGRAGTTAHPGDCGAGR